jgi:hypothetical protein
MKTLCTGLLVLSTIGLMECSNKTKETPEPVVPSSTINYAEVDGQSFQIDSTLTSATLIPPKAFEIHTDQKTTYLVIDLFSKPKGQSIRIGIYDFKMKPGKVSYPVNAPNQMFDPTGIAYGNASTPADDFVTYRCSSPDWSIDITEFDQVRQRVKGTFSGTLCTGTKTLNITKGRFNAPYRML